MDYRELASVCGLNPELDFVDLKGATALKYCSVISHQHS